MKKLLSIILAISMIMTSFAATVLAEETEAVEETEVVEVVTPLEEQPYYREVSVLSALGIMQGKSETDFGADDFLTRAEMSTVAVRFLGVSAESASAEKSIYSDVADDHWAKSYINMAEGLDIIHGNGDGTFEPEAETTAEQAIKIMVCALGYEPKAEAEGGYPTGYTKAANQLGLLKGVNFPDGYDQPIARWQIATIIYNALDVDLMEVKYSSDKNSSEIIKDKTALGTYHKVEEKNGMLEGTYASSLVDAVLYPDEVVIDGEKYSTDLSMTPYLGYNIDFYCTIEKGSETSKVIAFFPFLERSKPTEVNFDYLKSVKADESGIKVEYYAEDGKKEKAISASEPVIMYNGKVESFETNEEVQAFLDANMNQGKIVVLQNSLNDYNDIVFIENYDAYVVARADEKNESITYKVYEVGKTNDGFIDLSKTANPNRKYVIYGEDGKEIAISDLAENDVIMVYASTDTNLYKIYQSKKQVTGVINRRDEIPGTAPGPVEPLPTYWENITTVSISDYTQTSPTNVEDVTTGVYANTAIGSRTSYLYVQSGEYDKAPKKGAYKILESDKGIKRLFHKTGFIALPSDKYEWPTDFPISDGSKVFELSRAETSTWTLWNPWSPYYGKISTWAGAGFGAPDSYIMLTNLYDESEAVVGDKLRITAWLKANDIREVPTEKGSGYAIPAESDETTVPVQMWISESKSTDGDWQWGEDKDYEIGTPNINKKEHVTATLTEGEWTKVSLEYELTAENIGISSIQINNDNATHDVTHYPLELAIAGVTVERFVDPNVTVGRPEIIVDSTDYDIYVDNVGYKAVSNFPTSLLELGRNTTLLLDSSNKIVGYIRSLAKSGYGMVMAVGVDYNAFGSNLKVKILEPDGKRNTYVTTDEVKAFDGTNVVKMPAENLITSEPADPKTDWHLWSTNNAENFEAVPRTWLSDKDKSDAASRKIVYYETNTKGEIHTILVPSMPEDHPDAKIVMIKDFEYGTDTLYHSAWPNFLTHASVVGRTETIYRLANDAPRYAVYANEYNEEDYTAALTGGMWQDNMYQQKMWYQAQLYRYPGSKTVDFIVMNSHKPELTNSNYSDVIVVKEVSEDADGVVTIHGYRPNQRAANSSNHTYSVKVKENTRLMENLWMSAPDASGERLTWENISNYVGKLPYNCSYEALGMETPYVSAENIFPGDVVRIVNRDNLAEYVEVVRRKSTGLISGYGLGGRGNLDGIGTKDSPYMCGEVTEINIKEGYVKVRGFYWPHATDVLSGQLYTQSANSTNNYVTELEVVFRPTPYMVIYDESTDKYISAIFEDIDIGDIIFTSGYLNYPSVGVIFKNRGK